MAGPDTQFCPLLVLGPVLRGPSKQRLLLAISLRSVPVLGRGAWQAGPSLPSLCTPHFQATSGPRAFCVPRIILTECTSSSSSLQETSLEELGLRTAPTPRAQTLTGNGRAQDGSQALPGLAVEAFWSRPSQVSRNEPVLQGLDYAGSRDPCPWALALEETQKPATVETYSVETPRDLGCDAQVGNGGQRASSPGSTEERTAPLRMDSLEETLQELEATLREMDAHPTVECPGSLPPLYPRPQVAAFLLSSPVTFLLQCLSLRKETSGDPPTALILTDCSAHHLLGACLGGQGLWAEPGVAGKPAHPRLSPQAWA